MVIPVHLRIIPPNPFAHSRQQVTLLRKRQRFIGDERVKLLKAGALENDIDFLSGGIYHLDRLVACLLKILDLFW